MEVDSGVLASFLLQSERQQAYDNKLVSVRFLLSSSVVASSYEMCARAFEAGWAGAAFKTVSYMEVQEASPRYAALRGVHGGIIDDLRDWLARFLSVEGRAMRDVVGMSVRQT